MRQSELKIIQYYRSSCINIFSKIVDEIWERLHLSFNQVGDGDIANNFRQLIDDFVEIGRRTLTQWGCWPVHKDLAIVLHSKTIIRRRAVLGTVDDDAIICTTNDNTL